MKMKLFIAIVFILAGCATAQVVERPIPDQDVILFPFTAISFIEYSEYDYDTRTYHIRYSKRTSEEIATWYGKIGVIEGVIDISMLHHAVGVTKSPAYAWNEIEPKVKVIIEEFEESQPRLEKPEPAIERKDGV